MGHSHATAQIPALAFPCVILPSQCTLQCTDKELPYSILYGYFLYLFFINATHGMCNTAYITLELEKKREG